MNRTLAVLLVFGLLAVVAGCQEPPAPSDSGTTGVSQTTSSDLTLVTLKVPHMT